MPRYFLRFPHLHFALRHVHAAQHNIFDGSCKHAATIVYRRHNGHNVITPDAMSLSDETTVEVFDSFRSMRVQDKHI